MSKGLKIFIILYLTVMLSGCWDKVEINERAFVSAIGFDIYDEKLKKEVENNDRGEIEMPQVSERNRLLVTYVYPNFESIGKNATSKNPRYILSVTANNGFQAISTLAARTNKVLFFRHAKAVIIGEDTARDPEILQGIFDSLERHNQLNKKLILLIAEGTAKEVIETEDRLEPVTGTLLSEIIQKRQSSGRYNTETLQDVLTAVDYRGRALIPRVIPGKEELKLAGSAVIKNSKLIGWLGELENRAVMFLLDEIKSETIDIKLNNTWIPFIVTDSSTKKTAEVDGDNITINIEIEMEGYIQQYKLESEISFMDDKIIKSIENEVENLLKKQIDGTLKKLQKEFKVDVINIGDYLSKFKPDTWDKVKDSWEEIFPNVEINVSIDAKLRRIGMTK